MELKQAIYSRRAVRAYSRAPPNRAVTERLIDRFARRSDAGNSTSILAARPLRRTHTGNYRLFR